MAAAVRRTATAAAEVAAARSLRGGAPAPPDALLPSYPTLPRPPRLDKSDFFAGLAATSGEPAAVDAALFAFHFLPGSRAQAAAAGALHAASWRLHTRYGRWFRWPRGAGPEGREVTQTYDRGPFVYHDADAWMQQGRGRRGGVVFGVAWSRLSGVTAVERAAADPPPSPPPPPPALTFSFGFEHLHIPRRDDGGGGAAGRPRAAV